MCILIKRERLVSEAQRSDSRGVPCIEGIGAYARQK